MKIGFIGAGKVGTAFGVYLFKKGFILSGYYSKTLESAKHASQLTESRAYSDINNISRDSDILFITTNDDSIKNICNLLVENNGLREDQILVHMSGAASSKILDKAKEKKCYIYSLHPLQAFADIDKAIKDLENTVFSLEGDKEKASVIENILNITGNKYFKLTTEQKSIYHGVACIVSNYLVALMDYGLSLFELIGINKRDGYEALYPLIEGTMKNIDSLGTEKALTGPIARGDITTIKNHLEAIGRIAPKEREFYSQMGLKTLELAQKNKFYEKEVAEEFKKIFKGV